MCVNFLCYTGELLESKYNVVKYLMTLQEIRPENMYSRLLSASQEVIGLQ